ncbi:MAG TPA: hypothetical protein VMT16_02270 [Thermoanaerobaculia bacterium]|nr:hypothetical protein [Thermoanaerobaculia bacterium]
MVYSRATGGLGGFGGGGRPVPRDIVVLLAVVFGTFTLQFFAVTQIIPALLRLTELVWRMGFVWQVATYPFAGVGGPSFWFLLELFILFWFGRDVFWQLGRKSFWQLLAWVCIPAALAALLVDGVIVLTGVAGSFGPPFLLMQGQRMLLAVMVAAFATMNREATILLMFVLPVQARWFIPLEIVIAFLGFLGSKDLAGFVGVCVAVGLTYSFLTPGGLRRIRRETSLRLQQWFLRRRMERLRKKSGFRVVGSEDDRWLHRGTLAGPRSE